VPKKERVFDLLRELYLGASRECDIDIAFQRAADGTRRNEARDLVLKHAAKHSIDSGLALAERLARVTTHRSGLGLLFIVTGQEGGRRRLLISRFPADSGVLAETSGSSLSVEFVERVFMKSARSYKAVIYEGASIENGFWWGKAVDKQLRSLGVRTPNYWIDEFLASDFRTTAKAGTRRFAVAVTEAVRRASDLEVKQELVAVARLAKGLAGQPTTIRELMDRFGLSSDAQRAISAGMPADGLLDDRFRFDEEEFSSHATYKSEELDNGGMLTAEASKFDKIFRQEVINQATGRRRYTTEGKPENVRLRKTK
jgi:hypothetical protein